MKKKSLKERYEEVCNAYVKEFCERAGVQFDSWVSRRVGEIAVVKDKDKIVLLKMGDITEFVDAGAGEDIFKSWRVYTTGKASNHPENASLAEWVYVHSDWTDEEISRSIAMTKTVKSLFDIFGGYELACWHANNEIKRVTMKIKKINV
jgi:hypothetical protein